MKPYTYVFPTMVTPYTAEGAVDYEAARAMVHWYYENGCDGIFASCQSSEIFFLTEEDRVKLAAVVVEEARTLSVAHPDRPPMQVVASGHVSDDAEAQVRELCRVAETGVNAVILITNRMDIAHTGDEAWIRDCQRLIERLPVEVSLGLYECPHPYKRLLTPEMLRFCVSTGRFHFIKDTCCDAAMIEERLRILDGSTVQLLNANAQTLLASIRSGAMGYCGVMANFHPALYGSLCHHPASPMAVEIGDFLSMCAFTEALAYPITAKYHLSRIEGIPMTLFARNRAAEAFTPYHAMCVEQMDRAARRLLARAKEEGILP